MAQAPSHSLALVVHKHDSRLCFILHHLPCGLGIVPGILGINTALWGLHWLRKQPEQQAQKTPFLFKVSFCT